MGTYLYAEALTALSRQFPRIEEEAYGPMIANLANMRLWNAADWRETITELAPFWLVPGQQDYGAPLVHVPSDFGGLRQVFLVNVQDAPPTRTHVKVLRDLETTSYESETRAIGYWPAGNCFRLFPRPTTDMAPTTYLIDGTYKKNPTKITPALINSTLPWADKYFYIFLEVARWAAYTISGDKRANEAYGLSQALINEMMMKEGLDLGEQYIAPDEPLVSPCY